MRAPALLLPGTLLLTLSIFPACKSTPEAEEGGAATTAEAAGTVEAAPEKEAEPGKLFVKAVADFLKYEVLDAEGKVVETGDTNISTLELPAGDYRVVVNPAPFPKVELGTVTVKVGEITEPKLTGFGRVFIKGSKDFIRVEIVDGTDTVIASGDTNITSVLLPVGSYTARAGDKSIALNVAEFDKLDFQTGF